MDAQLISRITFDMETGRVLACASEAYSGPWAECGGSNTTNTVDKAYNARMASIAEKQQEWADKYMDVWDQYYKPYEIAQIKANTGMIPLETDLYKEQLEASRRLLPQQTAASEKFLQQSVNGVNVSERMGMAAQDVANAWKNTNAMARRENARMGVNPNTGRFQGIQAALNTQQAAQLAGARSQARVGAEAENYERLKNAATLNSASSLMQGMNAIKEE